MKSTPFNPELSRRKFINSLGCLTIGFSLTSTPWASAEPLLAEEKLPGSLQKHPRIDAWLEVLGDGRVRVLTGKMELGQGLRIAIAQVAAEELDLEVEQVEVHLAETGRTPNEGYTAGSGSMENTAMSVRYAAAAARQALLELAAKQWDVSTDRLSMASGRVLWDASKEPLTFAELLNGAQLEQEVKLPVRLKARSEYRYVGKPILRKDIEQMVRAQPFYVQDLRFPGMVHARVVRPPAYEAKLLEFNESTFQAKVPGLLKVVKNGSFLGLITTDEYQAVQGQLLAREHVRWSTPKPLPQGQPLINYLKKLPTSSRTVKEKGAVEVLDKPTKSTWKAEYFKPYQMHGSIGPSCSVALYDGQVLHVWTHTQGVFPLRDALSKMLGMKPESLHVIGVPGSGCYGHNGADDVAADAALLALAYPNKPVRLQWSREEEHAWEPYGSAMWMAAEANLDASGRITHWRYGLWSDSHSTRPGGNAGNLLAARYLEKSFERPSSGYSGGAYRNSEPYYAIPNLKVDSHFFEGPLRVSALRSLGAYGNIFAIESFMDELAHRAQKDPIEFRLMHSEDERSMEVLKKLQEVLRPEKLNANEGIGVAFSRYKNVASYCAVAAKVAVDKKTGDVRLLKMWAVIDAGEVINPDGVKNQTEGGMVQAASWTLKEEVLFDKQHVSSRDWYSYPIFRCGEVPEVEVVVIDRPNEEPLGAGEAAQGPAAAAVVNAIYRACGKRVRHLPVKAAYLK
ncbi:xanthine dehydrogenase family protein molybdopterin-binding subunit [Rhabdobacter roseus]|uniref:CO/xanthine dehydrogenase Mo-binding subunit n=1 Tax=Rhabdobacter roseus TaxID=1655419 RepID=A0A840TJV0_9BACT|nr:molybdopterin cofactor-binding domain-containing protein [Rhabdobacter roseus]MBB5284486.1 CO/xanthine dehydrogenase Mo-binding subunit [Rhabdobacter roseus]